MTEELRETGGVLSAQAMERLGSLCARIERAVDACGFAFVLPSPGRLSAIEIVELAGTLGSPYTPSVIEHSDHPVIESRPSRAATRDAPFDRPEAIGWHNDFSTHDERPCLSLAYLGRVDPRGPEHGAWGVASCDLILKRLQASDAGRAIVRFLTATTLPYSFDGEGKPTYFHAIERRGGQLGMRFYGRAMRDGARLAHCGVVPDEIEHAIQAVEFAADQVGHVLNAPAGSLLVTDNWRCLHDRRAQTVDTDEPRRKSLLCFVKERRTSTGT